MPSELDHIVNQMRKYVHQDDDLTECRENGHTLTSWANTIEEYQREKKSILSRAGNTLLCLSELESFLQMKVREHDHQGKSVDAFKAYRSAWMKVREILEEVSAPIRDA